MSKPRVVAEGWPIVVVEWPDGRVNVSELNAHFGEIKALLARPGKVVAVMDTTGANLIDSVFRARVASGVKAVLDHAVTTIAGVAYVASDPLVRGILTAIHWTVPVPFATTCVSSRAEAWVWANARLAPVQAHRGGEDRARGAS